ncbi:hypothetical protein CW706_02710 [Candidatus Bathyarchaeota archaeon]|nr:MAG: hypothetical protein CW706_02710 [Candidatus Bathyarchaeota archaeon]
MSDSELAAIRRKKLMEMMRLLKERKKEKEKRKGKTSQKILDRFLVGRAWEVLNAARAQYPQAAKYVESLLLKLIVEGRIRDKISGEDLYWLFRRLGVRVRLKTSIRVLEHGKLKSLEEKIREKDLS